MSIELFVLLILAAILLFAIIRGLLFIAILTVALAIAYYTGLTDALIDFLITYIPLIKKPEVALSILTTIVFV